MSYYNSSVMEISLNMTPSQRLDATFAALADPTRRAILARLSWAKPQLRSWPSPSP